MKRKTPFLQYKHSMMYKVFEATLNELIKNDFINTDKKYLKDLKANLLFEEIRNLSKWKFKKLSKRKLK
jgi:hypothetical protein